MKTKDQIAKDNWRKSDHGKAYMVEYHKAYMTPDRKAKKAKAQRQRRQTVESRRQMDSQYNAKYVRTDAFKSKKNEKRRLLRKTDISYRLTERLRGRIKDLLGRNKPESVSRSLGCTAEQLKSHLENNFLVGMNWENYGFYGWHIDHIKPLSSFDLTNIVEYREACHYTNLQPLWALDNLRKGATISDEQSDQGVEE